jgi:hypothetical protein
MCVCVCERERHVRTICATDGIAAAAVDGRAYNPRGEMVRSSINLAASEIVPVTDMRPEGVWVWDGIDIGGMKKRETRLMKNE